MKTDWTTCKAPVIGIVFWFALTLGFCITAGIILPLTDAPAWAMALFGAFALIAMGSGVAIARARIRYNEQEIQSRYFRHIKRKWADAIGWSRLGENGTLFIEFRDGAIIGSDGWALSDKDVEKLLPLLYLSLIHI